MMYLAPGRDDVDDTEDGYERNSKQPHDHFLAERQRLHESHLRTVYIRSERQWHRHHARHLVPVLLSSTGEHRPPSQDRTRRSSDAAGS